MKFREHLRREREARAQAKARNLDAEKAVADARAAGLEEITPADLRVISLALEDRVRLYPGQPAAVAADRVREKIARNMVR